MTIKEPLITCAGCGLRQFVGDLLYDEQAEHYLCSRDCFDEWHDANVDVVGDYYYRMNVDY